MGRSGKRPFSWDCLLQRMCRPSQAWPSPDRVSFRKLRKIAAGDRLYVMHQGISHSTTCRPSEPHPVHAGAHRRAAGWFVWGKGGSEAGRVLLGGPRLGPLGVWCLALLLCRVLAMRCDASPLPRQTLARKNSRADDLPAQVGSSWSWTWDYSAPRKRARKLAAGHPQISPCGAQAPHAYTVQLSSHVTRSHGSSPLMCINRLVDGLDLDGQDTAIQSGSHVGEEENAAGAGAQSLRGPLSSCSSLLWRV